MASRLIKPKPDFAQSLRINAKVLKELSKVDPRTRYVALFPNYDNAHVGMGFNLLNCKVAEDVYDNASSILKKDLLKLCLYGPKEELLNSMENRSIATFVTSHALQCKLAVEKENVINNCKAAGGFGVGFINCLVLSGSVSFEDGLDIVLNQARAIDRAAGIVPSAKIVVSLSPGTSKSKVCRAAVEHCISNNIPEEIAICSVSKQIKYNTFEIAGHEEAINYLEKVGRDLFRFKRIQREQNHLSACHTRLMQPAKDYLTLFMNDKTVEQPEKCSVYSATSGIRLIAPRYIKRDIAEYPVQPINGVKLLKTLFDRPLTVAQPNILVLWDKRLMIILKHVNRKAHDSAELLPA